MKYADKFPDMKPIVDERHNIIRSRTAEPCSVCGELTDYVEINYEGYFCSEECENEFTRRGDPS